MAKLEGELSEKVKELFDDINSSYNLGDYNEVLSLLFDAWELLPEPKYKWDESYTIVGGVLDAAIRLNDSITLMDWVDKIFLADPERIDSGEREMWAGRVFYELGKQEEAYNYFEKADIKSRGRCFWPSDKVYKNYYLKLKNK